MRRFLTPILLATALVVTGCSSTGSTADAAKSMFASDSLVSSLGTVGMSPSQATGSLGSLVSLASNRLSPADFSKFSGYLPNADKYLKAADAAGLLKSPVTDVAGLNKNFADDGCRPACCAQLSRRDEQVFLVEGRRSPQPVHHGDQQIITDSDATNRRSSPPVFLRSLVSTTATERPYQEGPSDGPRS